MTWIPFYNRLSLLLNFTRSEFGNGTSTIEHDYQIRLFQVILNFMNRNFFFLLFNSFRFVSYRIVSYRFACYETDNNLKLERIWFCIINVLIYLREDEEEEEKCGWCFFFNSFLHSIVFFIRTCCVCVCVLRDNGQQALSKIC